MKPPDTRGLSRASFPLYRLRPALRTHWSHVVMETRDTRGPFGPSCQRLFNLRMVLIGLNDEIGNFVRSEHLEPITALQPLPCSRGWATNFYVDSLTRDIIPLVWLLDCFRSLNVDSPASRTVDRKGSRCEVSLASRIASRRIRRVLCCLAGFWQCNTLRDYHRIVIIV